MSEPKRISEEELLVRQKIAAYLGAPINPKPERLTEAEVARLLESLGDNYGENDAAIAERIAADWRRLRELILSTATASKESLSLLALTGWNDAENRLIAEAEAIQRERE